MKTFKLVVLILLILVVILGFMPLIPQFFAYDDSLKELIFFGNASPGDTFSVSYIHSVNKSKVTDYFEITNDFKIMVTKTSFLSYGAGMPEPEPDTDQIIKTYEDHIDIENLNRILEPYKFFVGVTAKHVLSMNDTDLITSSKAAIKKKSSVNFTDYVSPQTSVIISIRKISPLAFLINMF